MVKNMVCMIMVFENCTKCLDVIIKLPADYQFNCILKENTSLLGYPGNAEVETKEEYDQSY